MDGSILLAVPGRACSKSLVSTYCFLALSPVPHIGFGVHTPPICMTALHGSTSLSPSLTHSSMSCKWLTLFSYILLSSLETKGFEANYAFFSCSLLLTCFFWLVAAISLSTHLGGSLNCYAQDVFPYCGQLNALAGLAFLNWYVLLSNFLFSSFTSC